VTRLVRAPNPGPMTLEGTNTWLVGHRRLLVVDPGPADPGHVEAVLAEVGRGGGVLGGVLLTHRHHDHADALAVPSLRQALVEAGAQVLAGDTDLGVVPDTASLALATDAACEALEVPGHTDDSVALVVRAERAVLTGDTVLGRGTSVVAHPDGDLGDYLTSLDLLLDLTTGTGPWVGLPGHGPVVDDLAAAVAALRTHRLQRVGEVRAALDVIGALPTPEAPDELVDAVVAWVYPEIDGDVVRRAAGSTVRATLAHLARVDGVPA
jgi:glyoxylase-like metal-dependent hydrolase (beta-lactamase superfamily II)